MQTRHAPAGDFPLKVLRVHLTVIAGLLAANLLGLVARYGFGHDHVYGLVALFDFDTEMNVPSLFSALMLLACSGVLVRLATDGSSPVELRLGWWGLALVFLFLAVDETFSLHEETIRPLRTGLHTSGLLYFAWVIPYGAAALLLLLTYGRFLQRLPRRTAALCVAAGAVFVSGAIGIEMLGGWYYERHGPDHALYGLLYTGEELLEMLGVALFLYALLGYRMRDHSPA